MLPALGDGAPLELLFLDNFLYNLLVSLIIALAAWCVAMRVLAVSLTLPIVPRINAGPRTPASSAPPSAAAAAPDATLPTALPIAPSISPVASAVAPPISPAILIACATPDDDDALPGT